ncbi:hypothetical protein [Microbacterium sp. SA39]|uniref:hypothetical protein n=1 Tax=Microbacterium sp. SA39 TaxID=1263625 RepID=UPI00136495CA|nr:hypothetical protein [Microbacterium sp. SA39]
MLRPDDSPEWFGRLIIGAFALALLAAVYFLGWTRTIFVKPDRVAWAWGAPSC